MALKYNLVSYGDKMNLTVVLDGDMLVADSTHPNWGEIYDAVVVRGDDERLADRFDPQKVVSRNFQRVSERVAVANGRVLFDGDPVDNSLTEQVLRFLNEGVDDWKPLVAFMEKVQTNPEQHSREQLYSFLANNEFSITDQGDIVGYKSVNINHGGGGYVSMTAGTAFVNGVEHRNICIPQNVGDVVEMPRSEVAFDPNSACSTGLHIANFNYASTWTSWDAIFLVEVNPRDVVSVPNDHNWSKVRVCRYKVSSIVDEPTKTALLSTGNSTGPHIVLNGENETQEDSWEDDDSWLDEEDSWTDWV